MFGRISCREKASLVDIKALVAFLEASEDDICVKDVLFMVLSLLTQKSFVASFIEHVNSLGGITILLNLIRRYVETTNTVFTDLLVWTAFLLFPVRFCTKFYKVSNTVPKVAVDRF